MGLTIRTNHHWRPFLYRHEVPAEVLASEFDWLSEDNGPDGYFRYHGTWYHVSQFLDCRGVKELTGWHGQHQDSYFSGVLIRLSDDGERYQVATYIA